MEFENLHLHCTPFGQALRLEDFILTYLFVCWWCFFYLLQLTELQRKEHEKKQLLDAAIIMAEKVVNGRLSKPGYAEGEANNKAKRQKLSAEIETMAASL